MIFSKKPLDGPPFVFDIEEYKNAIKELVPEYPELKIMMGIECGLQLNSETIKKNMALAEDRDLDYLIGSVHLVDGKDPYYPTFWEQDDASALVRRYFELFYENINEFHDFDSLGHLDYIVRYAPDSFVYRPEDYRDIIMEILNFIIQHDIALELNTSGWKSTLSPNPHISILEWYYSMGGRIVTVGSDAHVPEYLGFSFEKIPEILFPEDTPYDTGFDYYVTFQKHKPVFHEVR